MKVPILLWLREADLNHRPSGYEPDELPNCSIPRYKRLNKENGAGNRNRTGTGVTSHRILSPGRLPVPPLRRISLVQALKYNTIFCRECQEVSQKKLKKIKREIQKAKKGAGSTGCLWCLPTPFLGRKNAFMLEAGQTVHNLSGGFHHAAGFFPKMCVVPVRADGVKDHPCNSPHHNTGYNPLKIRILRHGSFLRDISLRNL